jgi:hypothetical protein
MNALVGMLRAASNYHAPVRRAVQKVVDFEVAEVLRMANYHVRSVGTFNDFIENFYRTSMPVSLEKGAWPVIQSFMIETRKQAALFIESEDIEDLVDLNRWMNGYMTCFIRRYVGSSEAQLKALIEKYPTEVLPRIVKRLGEWKERRAEKVASDEIVRSQNGMAMQTWAAQGVKKFRWVTNPKGHHCPYCSAMNGRTVKVGDSFFSAGETFYVKFVGGEAVAASVSTQGKKNVEWLWGKEEHKGVESKDWSGLKMWGDKRHPPIHKGCVCRIVPAK